MAKIELEVVHHDNIYFGFFLCSFVYDEADGDLSLEGPYLTVRSHGKSACILIKELIVKLIEHLE